MHKAEFCTKDASTCGGQGKADWCHVYNELTYGDSMSKSKMRKIRFAVTNGSSGLYTAKGLNKNLHDKKNTQTTIRRL